MQNSILTTTMPQNRVCCLYRVSTKNQVDLLHDDIPMQRIACHEFLEQQGWCFAGELSEKGISGFKVSANDRDAVQALKEKAKKKEFDILLVFMFDRLGRREDETPFVVEWFVKQGIRVWSVKEGEQRFDNHVDKLTNYIRYWQAAGESEKTSMRIKTVLSQTALSGHYHGGTSAFGYDSRHMGRVNKKGSPVKDLAINPDEAAVVRLIFDKYVNEGTGTQTMCTLLYNMGIPNRNGTSFTNGTIRHMLGRITYTGRIKCGDVLSEPIHELRIIDDETYERAQRLLQARALSNDKERTVPRKTTGYTLLSGNIFCASCGGRLNATSNTRNRVKADGTGGIYDIRRYVCYQKVRHHVPCAGQTGYVARKIDDAVDTLIRGILGKLRDAPAEQLVKLRLETKSKEIAALHKQAKADKDKAYEEMELLKKEVVRSIRGQSELPQSVLSDLLREAEEKVEQFTMKYQAVCDEMQALDGMRNETYQQMKLLRDWSMLYDSAGISTKKLIASQLIDRVSVHANYDLDIRFNITFEQFIGTAENINISQNETRF